MCIYIYVFKAVFIILKGIIICFTPFDLYLGVKTYNWQGGATEHEFRIINSVLVPSIWKLEKALPPSHPPCSDPHTPPPSHVTPVLVEGVLISLFLTSLALCLLSLTPTTRLSLTLCTPTPSHPTPVYSVSSFPCLSRGCVCLPTVGTAFSW